MTFGSYGGSHGHYDKISFVFFGHGQELPIDLGRAKNQAYRLHIHKNWYKATISHNNVLVDGQSQQPAKGQVKFFQKSHTHATIGAIFEEAYPGVKHTRTLSIYEDFLLLIDQL
jgi:oligo-alginate lyase